MISIPSSTKTAVVNLANHKSEPRVDSRVAAKHLGIKHKSIIQLVRRYKDWRTHLKRCLKNSYDYAHFPLWFVRLLFVIFRLKAL